MSDETLFYVFGIGLAVSAVVVSFLGLKVKGFPGRAFPVVVLWFAVFVGGASTYAVLHAKHEQEAKAAETEAAGEGFEEEAADVEATEAPAEEEGQAAQPEGEAAAKGGGETIQLAADPSAIAYDKTELASKPGEVTIDFTNPSPLQHDVAIEKGGKEIAASELIAEGETSVSANLPAGTYTFLCTVPGHAEAGMEGALVVK